MYFIKFVVLLFSGVGLFGASKVNLKYERLWTDLLPYDMRITSYNFGKSEFKHYKNDFRGKYIGLFIVPDVGDTDSYKNVVDFAPFLREYAKTHKKNISILLDGSDAGIKSIFGKTMNENLFYVKGNIYKRGKTAITSHLITYGDKYNSEPSSPRWLLIFDTRGKYVDNVRIEIINDANGKKEYRPWKK